MYLVLHKNFVVDGVEGTLIYTVEECIAKCRNGVVLKARVVEWPHPDGPEFLAIKQLNGNLDDNLFEKQFEEYSKQIGYLEKLCHDNILRYYTVFKTARASDTETSKICIVMEYCSADFEKVWRSLGRLGIYTAIGQVVLGLSYLHSNGIVHGDLKPANILAVEGQYGMLTVKICDLDESVIVGKGNIDEIGIEFCIGTPMYYSPEMASRIANRESDQKVGFRTDIWSLGCVVLDIAAGIENECRIILGNDGEQLGASLGKEVSVMASSGVPPNEFDLYLRHILSGGVPAVKTLQFDLEEFASSCLAHNAAERCGLKSIFSSHFMHSTNFCHVRAMDRDVVFLLQSSKLVPEQYVRELRAIIGSNLYPKESYIVVLYPDTDSATIPDSIKSVWFTGFANWTSGIYSHDFFASVEKVEFEECSVLAFRSGSPLCPKLQSLHVDVGGSLEVNNNVLKKLMHSDNNSDGVVTSVKNLTIIASGDLTFKNVSIKVTGGRTCEVDDKAVKELMPISTFDGSRQGRDGVNANSHERHPRHQLSPKFVSVFPMPKFNWSDVMGKLAHYSPFFEEGTAKFREMQCISLTASLLDFDVLIVITLVANPHYESKLWEEVGQFLKQLSQIIDGHPCALSINCEFPANYWNGETASDMEHFAIRVSSALSAIQAHIVKLTIGEKDYKNPYYIKELLRCLELPQLLELKVNCYSKEPGLEFSYKDFAGFPNLRKLLIPVHHFDADRPVFGAWREHAFTRVDDTPMVDNIRQSRLSDHGFKEGELWELKGNGYLYRSDPFRIIERNQSDNGSTLEVRNKRRHRHLRSLRTQKFEGKEQGVDTETAMKIQVLRSPSSILIKRQ